MPSHISHLLFAREVLSAELGAEVGQVRPIDGVVEGGPTEALLASYENALAFGAQGPDFFYHNQRTRPVALRYGTLLHQKRYGSLVARMTAYCRRHGLSTGAELAFLLGFVTHAALDRFAHPYIISRAGWVTPSEPLSRRFHRCHTFLERLLDVLLLHQRFGGSIERFDFFSQVYLGERLPYGILKMLVTSINAVFPEARYKSRDRRRVENAYADSIRFYSFTDPHGSSHRRRLLDPESLDPKRRRIAVFHPARLPIDLDVGNSGHDPWHHPCDDRVSTDGYLELYETAIPHARRAVRAVWLGVRGECPLDEIEQIVGNASLNLSAPDGSRCRATHADPLPLWELLDRPQRLFLPGATGTPDVADDH